MWCGLVIVCMNYFKFITKKIFKMKKLIVLFVAALALSITSCGNDDDEEVVAQDPIIGSWQFTQELENDEPLPPTDPCSTQDFFTYNDDGTFTIQYFSDDGGTCIAGSLLTGTWENVGNSVYVLTAGVQTERYFITFSGNTLSHETVITQGGTTTVYKVVYTKV